jgi:NADPH:quinone reductase-like Zn-dependent oxidoreductase
MRAAGIETFGGEVQILELAAPQSLAPDEVVIAVRAAGVGNWDEIVRAGGWNVGRQPPLVLGVEAAGVVVAVGEEVTSPGGLSSALFVCLSRAAPVAPFQLRHFGGVARAHPFAPGGVHVRRRRWQVDLDRRWRPQRP